MYTVSITSQGQMSIPSSFRKKLNLEKFGKALVTLENGKLVISPVRDILDLAGTFKTKRKVSSGKIKEAFGKYLADQAVRS